MKIDWRSVLQYQDWRNDSTEVVRHCFPYWRHNIDFPISQMFQIPPAFIYCPNNYPISFNSVIPLQWPRDTSVPLVKSATSAHKVHLNHVKTASHTSQAIVPFHNFRLLRGIRHSHMKITPAFIRSFLGGKLPPNFSNRCLCSSSLTHIVTQPTTTTAAL